MDTTPRTAIIGAGPDGATCASVLGRQSIEVAVYDANGDAGSEPSKVWAAASVFDRRGRCTVDSRVTRGRRRNRCRA